MHMFDENVRNIGAVRRVGPAQFDVIRIVSELASVRSNNRLIRSYKPGCALSRSSKFFFITLLLQKSFHPIFFIERALSSDESHF